MTLCDPCLINGLSVLGSKGASEELGTSVHLVVRAYWRKGTMGLELLRGCAVEKCPALCQQAVCVDDVRAYVVLRQLMCRQEQRKWIQR